MKDVVKVNDQFVEDVYDLPFPLTSISRWLGRSKSYLFQTLKTKRMSREYVIMIAENLIGEDANEYIVEGDDE